MTTLVISPHLDDAVLSLGGSIAAWVRAGERVVVATVYTAGPPLDEISPDMRRFADYAARRTEDTAACAILGCETRWLDQIERAFRRPFLTSWAFFATPPDRSGLSTLARVTAALQPLNELDPQRIAVPLGIGNHIDHVEALVAATDWALAAGWRDRLWFYEDFYALSGTLRRRHPIASRHPLPRWRSPLFRARRLAIVLRAIGARQRGPASDAFLARELRDAAWAATRSPIDETRKLAAIECYASQTAAFGGLAGISRAMRAFHALWDGGEPLWRATA
jgi:LmbE family N-acetylglucosaminyl deacetylase